MKLGQNSPLSKGNMDIYNASIKKIQFLFGSWERKWGEISHPFPYIFSFIITLYTNLNTN